MPHVIEINNFNAPELDIYARLSENQLKHIYEPKNGLFIAESPKVIERALNFGCTPVSLLLEKKHIDGQAKKIIDLCSDIPVYTAEFDILTKLTGFELTRGALCAMYRPALPNLEDILSNSKRIAILENVMNPTNVGAIFRCAAALNIDAILLTPSCSDPLYRRCLRVSMGTVFQIPWTYTFNNSCTLSKDKTRSLSNDKTCSLSNNRTNALSQDKSYSLSYEAIDILKNHGFKTAAMALREDSVNVNDEKLMSEEKLAIILGTEGDGLAKSTIDNCDYTVCIPMSHEVDSLNVAAASAIAFWQLGGN